MVGYLLCVAVFIREILDSDGGSQKVKKVNSTQSNNVWSCAQLV